MPSGSVSGSHDPTGLGHGDAELGGDRIDLVHPHVDERVRRRIAGVLGEVDLGALAPDSHIRRKVRLEPVLELLLEAEPAIPDNGCRSIGDAQDRNDVGGHVSPLLIARV